MNISIRIDTLFAWMFIICILLSIWIEPLRYQILFTGVMCFFISGMFEEKEEKEVKEK